MKTFGMADVIAMELLPFREKIEAAFVFGSVARGSDRPDSDVDMFDLGPVLQRLQQALGREVDLNLHTPSEWRALAADGYGVRSC